MVVAVVEVEDVVDTSPMEVVVEDRVMAVEGEVEVEEAVPIPLPGILNHVTTQMKNSIL